MTKEGIWAKVAAREGVLQSHIEQQLRRMINAPKEASVCEHCDGTGLLTGWLSTGWHPCHECAGAGILLYGVPWRFQ